MGDPLTIGRDESILAALNRLNDLPDKIVVVVGTDGRVLGTITDGDVRRYLVSGGDVSARAMDCMNDAPLVDRVGLSPIDARAAMERLSLRGIPIVDEGMRYQGMHVRPHDGLAPQQRSEAFLIMAGGRGERLRPITQELPKPLVKVGGVPMVEAIVRRAHELGFNEIWVALHHEAAQIRTHIDTLRHEGITCQYIIEEVPLGTIGAVSRLPETAQREGVVVCNADIVQSVNFQELADRHADSEAAMTLGVVEHTVAVPFAVVEHEAGRVVTMIEKPILTQDISCGVCVVSHAGISLASSHTPLDVPDLVTLLLRQGQSVQAFQVAGYWRDVGTPESLEQAARDHPTVLGT